MEERRPGPQGKGGGKEKRRPLWGVKVTLPASLWRVVHPSGHFGLIDVVEASTLDGCFLVAGRLSRSAWPYPYMRLSSPGLTSVAPVPACESWARIAWDGSYAGKVGFWGASDDLEVGSVPAYIVEYGLRDPEESHPRLSRAIKERYRYWRILEFTWIVEASESASRIFDYLEPNIDQDDKLFVCKLAGDAAMADSFSDQGAAWLEQIL